jgi:site-specific recombinase XerD
MELYNYERRIKRIEENITQNPEISQADKELILKFRNECFANNLSLARTVRYLFCLRDMAKWLKKNFLDAKTEDIKELVGEIERMQKYSPRTKYEYRATLKKFYGWLKNEEAPEEIAWIKLNLKKHNNKLPSDLITENEVIKMINHAQNHRDRAIIMTLYESGCRVGEFLKMRIKDVSFERYGALLNVTGKTGGRRILVVTSSNYLMELINIHPYKDNPDAFLFLKKNTEQMLGYPALCKVLRTMAKRAGIKKKVNPHNFRHSRATQLANKLTEQQLKVFFGWTRSSEMASVYVHLSGRDVNNALLETYGIKPDEDEKTSSKLIPIKCMRCNFENEPTNKFCKMCGMILNKEEADKLVQDNLERDKIDSFMNKVIGNKELLNLLVKKLVEVEKTNLPTTI